jgi:hypothetical protein
MSVPDPAIPAGCGDARCLLQNLFAGVRPEFRGDELVFDPRRVGRDGGRRPRRGRWTSSNTSSWS